MDFLEAEQYFFLSQAHYRSGFRPESIPPLDSDRDVLIPVWLPVGFGNGPAWVIFIMNERHKQKEL